MDVPRPISSRITKLRGVAWVRIAAVSTISTMKVERPRARSSPAPTRLNRRSTTPSCARAAGTIAARLRQHAPAARSGAGRSTCRPCWGRSISHSRSLAAPSAQSLGTKRSPACAQRRLDHRMAPAFDLEARLLDDLGPAPAALRRALGLAGGDIEPRQAPPPSRRSPRRAATTSPTSSSKCASSAASAWPPASAMRLASSCSDGELKRTALAIVWRWVKPLSAAISASACARGHLDEIAEHAVVADLERGDAGLVAVLRLERGDRAAGMSTRSHATRRARRRSLRR